MRSEFVAKVGIGGLTPSLPPVWFAKKFYIPIQTISTKYFTICPN
jgi:hypothetical protein